jgi:hypothetical protein
MEFWIGLSVGMHLGKVLADYLQRFVDAYGLLDMKTIGEIKEIEDLGGKLSSVVDAELSDD